MKCWCNLIEPICWTLVELWPLRCWVEQGTQRLQGQTGQWHFLCARTLNPSARFNRGWQTENIVSSPAVVGRLEGGLPKLVLCCVPAGLGGRKPRLVLLRVSPTGRHPHVRQLLPSLPSQVSVGRVQAQRWRIALAVRRLQGRWSN